MPSFATAFAETEDHETRADEASQASLRPAFAARLLLKLVRIAGAANEDRATRSEPRPSNRRASPNHCEFDYDYYVALQNRRGHQPSRLDGRKRSDIQV